MTETLIEEVKRRAYRELGRRDDEGSFVGLNYRQKRAFKEENFGVIRPVLDQHLKRARRTLWWMGLSIPLLLVLELSLRLDWWSGSAGEGSWDAVLGLMGAALWSMFFMGYALKVALPRIAALERARMLFELHETYTSRLDPQGTDTIKKAPPYSCRRLVTGSASAARSA